MDFPWYTPIDLKNGYDDFLKNNPTKYIHLTYIQVEQIHKMFYMSSVPDILSYYTDEHGKYFKQLKWPPQVFDIIGVTSTLLPPERYIEFESYFKPSPFNFVVYRYIQIKPEEIICARGYTSTSFVPLDDFKSDYLMIIRIKKGDRILFFPTSEFEIVLPECCLIQQGRHEEGVYTYEITPYKVDKKMDAILATEMMDINFSKRKRRREHEMEHVKDQLNTLIFKNDLEGIKKLPLLDKEFYYTLINSNMYFEIFLYLLDKVGKLTEKQYYDLLKNKIASFYPKSIYAEHKFNVIKFLIPKVNLKEGIHNHTNYHDYSPLQLAILKNNLEIVQLLLEPSKNNLGSALDFAKTLENNDSDSIMLNHQIQNIIFDYLNPHGYPNELTN